MPRRLDTHADLVDQYREVQARTKLLSAQARLADKEEKAMRAELIKIMGKSVIAVIEDEPVFEVGVSGRDSTTVPLVKAHAPEDLWPLMIKHITWNTIKFFEKG